MFLAQLAYCSRMLQQFEMEMAKAASTLMVENIEELFLEPVSSKEQHKEGKAFPYRSLIRSLLYLSTHTTHYITYHICGQHVPTGP